MHKKYIIDIVFNDSAELLKILEGFTKAKVSYKVLRAKGPAGGWPEIELQGSSIYIEAWLIERDYEVEAVVVK